MLRNRILPATLALSLALFPAFSPFLLAEGVSITAPDEPAKPAPTTNSAPAPTQPATQTAPTSPSAPVATTAPASSQPTAESILQGLLQHGTVNPPIEPTQMGPNVTPPVAGAAPSQPAAERLREGAFVWNRAGRLVHDDKLNQPVFAFESDGKIMQDPPMILLPCRNLMAMEKAANGGKTKFKVSGQVTEYNGKNYLLVTFMQPIRDLNQF